jgi:hypothetical protein
MAIKLGSTDINSVNLGSVGLNRIYSGSDFVFGGVAPFEFGNALQFDGINDYVDFNPQLSSGSSTSFLLNFWFKTSNNNVQSLIESFTIIDGLRIINDTTIRAFFQNNGYQNTFTLPSFTDGNWHHVMFGRDIDGTTLKFYFDGVDYSSGSTTLTILFGRLGQSASNLRPLDGALDEIVFAYEEPTLIKAQAAYNNGAGNSVEDWLTVSAELIYHLDESGADTIAIDSSVNGNNGTLNNFTGTYWVTH